jgi:hypothetical protein
MKYFEKNNFNFNKKRASGAGECLAVALPIFINLKAGERGRSPLRGFFVKRFVKRILIFFDDMVRIGIDSGFS